MKATNSLTSHCGERSTHRADKMSGDLSRLKKIAPQEWRNQKSNKVYKRLTNKKRRMFLKSVVSLEKI